MQIVDRELLELAAKAAGYKGVIVPYGSDKVHANMPSRTYHDGQREYLTSWGYKEWNPLHNDGDALRLAVKLEILVEYRREERTAFAYNHALSLAVLQKNNVLLDCYAATRRAIVRAAAEIGRQMQEGEAA